MLNIITSTIINILEKFMFKRAKNFVSNLKNLFNDSPLSNGSSSFVIDNGLGALSEDDKPTHSAVWAAVNLIANNCAALPLELHYGAEGKRKKLKTKLVYLLQKEPSQTLSGFTFQQAMFYNRGFHGNGYAYICRNTHFAITGFLLLDPKRVTPFRQNGIVKYMVNTDSKMVVLESNELLHLRGIGNELEGFSIAELAKVSFCRAKAMEKFGLKYFQNSAKPGAVIEVPKTMTDTAFARLKKSFEDNYKGVENSNKTAILEEGAKLNTIGATARDAMLIDASEFQIIDIANWFGIQASRLNANINSSYKSLEQQNQNFLTDTLNPYLKAYEQECFKKLLTEKEKLSFEFEFKFNRNEIVQTDLITKANYLRIATAGAPFITPNEARNFVNFNDVPNGDKIIYPSNNFGTEDPKNKAAKEPKKGASSEDE